MNEKLVDLNIKHPSGDWIVIYGGPWPPLGYMYHVRLGLGSYTTIIVKDMIELVEKLHGLLEKTSDAENKT